MGAALLLPGCSARPLHAVRIGSQRSRENATIAEIYAVALERANIAVEPHMDFDSAQALMASIQRRDIDLYPGHVLAGPADSRAPSIEDSIELNSTGRSECERRYGITWLTPSPVNDSPCLATSQYAAEQYWLLTLTTCAELAPKLRFAATADFLAAGGALKRLQERYGGFRFKKVVECEPGTQYYLLNRGEADVANAFTTDSNIPEDQLVVLADDKHFWPRCNVAPVIRLATVHAHPRVPSALNAISRTLTQYAVQQMNMHRDLLDLDPRDVAEEFVRTNHLDLER